MDLPEADNASLGNPFSTRYVRPGAIEYLFPAGQSADLLVARLRDAGWWGQITGPHGGGKSTLVETLRPLIAAAGRQPIVYRLHDGQRRLPRGDQRLSASTADAIVVVDGYEQLGRLARFRLRRVCRRRGWGLLATAHASVGLPALYEVCADAQTAARVAGRLLSNRSDSTAAGELVSTADAARCFHAYGGNLREMLFALYDLYELRRRRG
jgi:hypothetical protein